MESSTLLALMCFVIGILILGITFKNKVKYTPKTTRWQEQLCEEHALNYMRSKPLPKDLFLTIDFSCYPVVLDKACQTGYLELLSFAKVPMTNLSHESNFELKQQFGTKGFEQLITYEKNYFRFIDTCYEYATLLYEHSFVTEAQKVLEHTLSLGCDYAKVFLLLGDIYHVTQNFTSLVQLQNLARVNMANSPLLNKVIYELSSKSTNESEMIK